jgi:PPM family protein phosphatase
VTPQLRYGACSEIGLVREVNEDSMLHDPPLFAVADGMGGHLAGDVASQMAIEQLVAEYRASDSISGAVRHANRAIFRAAQSDPELSGMGTTITAMIAGEDSAQIVHVGDSRAYLLRNGDLSRITQDHTVVGRLVQQGRIAPEDADRHPQRSYLERALGVDPDVEVDVYVLDTSAGDRILLCSDGLFGMIDDDVILAVLDREKDPQRAAERLCEEAVEAGGADNVTTVVIDYPEASDGRPATAGRIDARPPRTTGPLGGSGSSPSDQDRPWDAARYTAAPSNPSGRSAPDVRSPAQGDVRPSPSGRPAAEPPRRSGGRSGKLLAYLVVFMVVLGVAALAVRASIRSSWYVGTNSGKVAVFNGIDGSVAGIELSKVSKRTDLETASLPDLYQTRLKEGIGAKSLKDANSIVDNLRKLMATPAPQGSPAPSPASPAPPQG